MKRITDELDAIEYEINAQCTPADVFRILTSQTELRKWWAPRIIMARNLVTQQDGQDMEMKAIAKEKNHMVRYSWRGHLWPDDTPATIITFEIEDRGVRRDKAGEGVVLYVSHGGWFDEDLRESQAEIWESAVQSLKSLLQQGKAKPWWTDRKQGDFLNVQLNDLKEFIKKIEEENRAKKEKKIAAKNLWKMFQDLDGSGEWYLKDNGTEMEFRAKGHRIFGAMKNGQIIIGWRDFDPLLGKELQDFTDRFSIEQDLDIRVSSNQDRIPAAEILPDLFVRWVQDVLSFRGEL